MNEENPTTAITPFERIRRTNPTGSEFWSSRDFAQVLGYTDYRNFEAVIEKARTACFNSGQRVEDHFVEITEMIEIGKGGQRAVHGDDVARRPWGRSFSGCIAAGWIKGLFLRTRQRIASVRCEKAAF
jgi:hypothetical protein